MHGGEADEQLMITQLVDSLEAKNRTQPLAAQEIACYEVGVADLSHRQHSLASARQWLNSLFLGSVFQTVDRLISIHWVAPYTNRQ